MKILISGGAKSGNIVKSIQAKFQSSGDEFLVVPYIEDINSIYSRGDYFDRALISFQSLTRDGARTDEHEIRQMLNQFAISSAKRGKKSTYIFLGYTNEMALMMYEEILPLKNLATVLMVEPPYSVQFFTDVLVNDINQLPDEWIFKAPALGNSVYKSDLFNNDIPDEDVDNEVMIRDSDDDEYDSYEEEDNEFGDMDDIDLPEDFYDDEDDTLVPEELEDDEAWLNEDSSGEFEEGFEDEQSGYEEGFTGDDGDFIGDEGFTGDDGDFIGDEGFTGDDEGFEDEQSGYEENFEDGENFEDEQSGYDEPCEFGAGYFDDNEEGFENNEETDNTDWADESFDDEPIEDEQSGYDEGFEDEQSGYDEGFEDEQSGYDEGFEDGENFEDEQSGYEEGFEDMEPEQGDFENIDPESDEYADGYIDPSEQYDDEDTSEFEGAPFEDNEEQYNEEFNQSEDWNGVDEYDETPVDNSNKSSGLGTAVAAGAALAAGMAVGKTLSDIGHMTSGPSININSKGVENRNMNNNDFLPGFDDDDDEVNSNFGVADRNDDKLVGFGNPTSAFNDDDYSYDDDEQSNYSEDSNLSDDMMQGYSQDDYTPQNGMNNNYDNNTMGIEEPQKKKGLKGLFGKLSGGNNQQGQAMQTQGNMGQQMGKDLGAPVNPAMQITNGKGRAVNVNKVRESLRPFAARGNAITVTGFGGCGTSTVAYGLANIICQLGYTVLLVDFDVEGRTQSYITRTNYETMEPDGANIMAAVNSSTGVKQQMTVVKEGFHLLTMGLGADVHPIQDIIKKEKLNRFFNTVKNEHQFVVYDIPFALATDYCSEITYNSDNIVTVADCSNWGLAKMLLQVCNIKSEDMQDTIFNRAQLVLNKQGSMTKLFGQRFSSGYDILNILDKQVLNLVGEETGFYFSDLHISGIIPDDKAMEDGWFGDGHYSDTRKGQNIFVDLLQHIVLKK